MKKGLVVMNKKSEFFIIFITPKRVYFEKEDELIFTEERSNAILFLMDSFSSGQLFVIGDL